MIHVTILKRKNLTAQKKMQQQDVFLGFKTQSSISRQETAKFCSEKDNIDLLGSNIDKTV